MLKIVEKDALPEREDVFCPVCNQWLAGIYPDVIGDISVQCSSCSAWVMIQVK